MARIINRRGVSGAGKTELVRRVLAGCVLAPAFQLGRRSPIAYRAISGLGRPFIVIGDYGRRSGGCDTITQHDGGLNEAFRMADAYADEGISVVLEGLLLSEEVMKSARLAQKHDLRVICLTTSTEICVRQLLARRRVSATLASRTAALVSDRQARIASATEELLRQGAHVQYLSFAAAFSGVTEVLAV